MNLLLNIIDILVRVITLLVIVYVILGYFMSPYHPVRLWVNRIVEPMLAPIRRFVPPIANIDFSPFILLILIQVLERLLFSLLI